MPTLVSSSERRSCASVAVGLILVGCRSGGHRVQRGDVPRQSQRRVVRGAHHRVDVFGLLHDAADDKDPGGHDSAQGRRFAGLARSTASVVLLPVLGGLLMKRFAPSLVRVLAPFCPLVAVVTVALICASIIGSSSAAIVAAGPALLGAVSLHSAGIRRRILRAQQLGLRRRTDEPSPSRWACSRTRRSGWSWHRRTADPLVAVPCAISATVHSCCRVARRRRVEAAI